MKDNGLIILVKEPLSPAPPIDNNKVQRKKQKNSHQ